MEYNAVLVFQGTDVNKCDQAMATPSKVHLPGGLDPSTTILSFGQLVHHTQMPNLYRLVISGLYFVFFGESVFKFGI